MRLFSPLLVFLGLGTSRGTEMVGGGGTQIVASVVSIAEILHLALLAHWIVVGILILILFLLIYYIWGRLLETAESPPQDKPPR